MKSGRKKPGLRKLLTGRPAQVSLELAASFIVVFVLIFGALQVFLWVNKRLVQRQKDYEDKRVDAGSAGNNTTEIQVDETDLAKYPKLNVFGQ